MLLVNNVKLCQCSEGFIVFFIFRDIMEKNNFNLDGWMDGWMDGWTKE